ncbi:MAG: hypothetical protein HKN23_03160 [Verrucomicrobiales bacterium]|nr:hypothetical protein [Verrucomicrobiales bacterium]
MDRKLQEIFASDEGDETGIARASLINLAIYSEDPETLAADAENLARIVEEAACRSILISANSAGDVSARSWVQAHCQVLGRDERKSVCTEQLAFQLTGATPGLVRNTVFAHLDSDLPLVFWWRGDFSEAFSDRLYTRIDRLIFDSEHWTEPRSQFLRLKRSLSEDNSSFVPHDLSFTRLNPIRTGIAKCFDNVRAKQETGRIEEINVSFGNEARMSAIYFAAWAASRLGCELDPDASSEGEFRFRRRRSGERAPLQIRLHPGESGIGGEIEEVELFSPDSEFRLRRCEKKVFWELTSQIGGGAETVELLPTHKPDDAFLVAEILQRGGRNRVLCDVLPVVREMLLV